MADTGMIISGGRTRPMAEVEDLARRAASGFQALGVRPGDAVALLLRNDFAFLEATYAAQALGAYAVPINWHLAAPEVAYVLSDSAARVLVAHADLLAAVPDTVAEAAAGGVTVIAVPTPPKVATAYGVTAPDLAPDAPAWDAWLAGFEPLAEQATQLTDNVYYTSGTTGVPKGVRRFPQPREAAAQFAAMRDTMYDIRADARGLVAGPLYHSAPNSFGLRSARVMERLVLMPRFDAERFLALVAEHRITNSFLVPTMLVRLLKLPEAVRAKYDVSSLRYVLIAAAPCPPEVKRAMMDWWGPIVHEFFGTTELGYMTYCRAEDALARPGTAGRPVDGTVLKALDPDGNEVPTGTPG